MKKFLLTIITGCLISMSISAQTVQFTLVATTVDTLQLYFKPTGNIGPVATGISNLTFVLQQPQTYPSPQDMWTLIPNTTYLGVATTTTATSTANGNKYNTLFSFTSNPNINGTTFTDANEYLLATIVTPTGVPTSAITLTDWGNNRIDNAPTGAPIWATSLAIDGLDRTNNSAIFYSNASTSTLVNSGATGLQSTLGIGTPLGVSIIRFSGSIKGDKNVLDWLVGEERNIKQYAIEFSTDLSEWREAGIVSAINTSNPTYAYQYIHTHPNGTNTIHYRLRIDENNKMSWYSSAIRLQRENGTALPYKVYPNVVKAGTAVTIDFSDQPLSGQLIVLNTTGQEVSRLSFTDSKLLRISTETLTPGIYYIQAADDNIVLLNKKLIVQ